MCNFNMEGDQFSTMIIRIIGAVIYSLWPILAGNELNQLLPKKATDTSPRIGREKIINAVTDFTKYLNKWII